MKPPADKMSATNEASDFSIRNYGKFAVVIARLNYSVTSEGKTLLPRSIRATYVCRKENGAWKIASPYFVKRMAGISSENLMCCLCSIDIF